MALFFVSHHVQADVIFQDLGHQAVDTPTDVGKEHQYVGTIIAGGERTLDGINLPANAFDPGYEFLFFSVDVCHFSLLIS